MREYEIMKKLVKRRKIYLGKLRSCRFVFLRMARVRCEVLWELAGQRLKKELWRLGENEIELP